MEYWLSSHQKHGAGHYEHSALVMGGTQLQQIDREHSQRSHLQMTFDDL